MIRWNIILAALGLFGLSANVGVAQTSNGSSESVTWSLDQIHGIVDRVGAGRSLKPAEWPGGARVAVLFSFDVDNETVVLRFGDRNINRLSEFHYGARVGLKRIVGLMDRNEIPASFFIPAVSLLLDPRKAEIINASGRHEIGVHGWIHEDPTTIPAETERDLLARSIATIEEITGVRPVGFRAPSWTFSEHTLDYLLELGFAYDSSLMADDAPYEVLRKNEPTGLVELPVSWVVDDAVWLQAHGSRAISPRQFLTILKDDFDMAYREGTMFLLTAHPSIIGRRSAFAVLEEFVKYAKSKPGVWFATHKQAADYVRAQAGME